MAKLALHCVPAAHRPQRKPESRAQSGSERARRPAVECEGESVTVSGLLPGPYIPVIFKHTPPRLLQCFLSGPLRKPVWPRFLHAHSQVRTESKNDSIETRRLREKEWRGKRGGLRGEK